jgi:oxaloacetate decarboxylase beta subunit
MDVIYENLLIFWQTTGIYNLQLPNIIMMLIGAFFVTLAITKNYEPILLVPIGFGVIVGNLPVVQGMMVSVYDIGFLADGTRALWGEAAQGNPFTNEKASTFSYFYYAVTSSIFPPLIFIGIGAMMDFSTMLSNPRLVLVGVAAQLGILLTLVGAIGLGFTPKEAASIAIIGSADGPTSIFLCSNLAMHLIGPVAIAAYSYMALVPVIQPPVMRLCTTLKERKMRMLPSRAVSKRERIIFPIAATVVFALIVPGSLVLIGSMMFGNLLKECGVTERLAEVARTAVLDGATMLLGFSVGASTAASTFLRPESIKIFGLGAFAFVVSTAVGIMGVKLINLFLKEKYKINPLVGACGVSAMPAAARIAQRQGHLADPHNNLLMYGIATTVSGTISSAVLAGYLWSIMR